MSHGLEAFETKMVAKRSGKVGFDPMSILAAIIALLANCQKPTPAQLRRTRRARLAIAIRRETGATWGDSFEQADDALAVANEGSDAELQEFIDDCCN